MAARRYHPLASAASDAFKGLEIADRRRYSLTMISDWVAALD